jgi:hypothetical protein
MAARERQPSVDIEALVRDTNDLRPTNDFSDAVMAAIGKTSAEDVLARAQRATDSIAPTDDFVTAVMQSMGQGSARAESGWQSGVTRFSRFALMGAAAAAALCLWLSSRAETSFDAAILEGVASIEVDE